MLNRFTLTTFMVVLISSHQVQAAEIIHLTQTACQFIEPEGGDKNYTASNKKECDQLNAKNGTERVKDSKIITLKPGEYIFRVKNEDVPYSLGFWLRNTDYDWRNPLHKITRTSVSGGGLTTGTSLDYKVTLKPGEYFYSCPLNTTPDYKLVVSDNG